MRNRLAPLAVALVALLGLSGCELRGELVVRPDGSGTFTYVMGIDKDVLARIGPEEDPRTEMRRTVAAQPFPIELTDYETAKVVGLRARFKFATASELHQRLDELHAKASRLAAAFTFADLLVRKTRSGWWFQARTAERHRGPAALPFDVEEQGGGVPRAEFRVTLPGHDRDDNAYRTWRRNGATTFRWRIGTDTGMDDYKMRAETIRPAGQGSPWPAVLLGLGLAVAVPVMLRRRRRVTPAP